jgi:hypothetical protein
VTHDFKSWERVVARILSKTPKIKSRAKFFYQFINSIIYKSAFDFVSEVPVEDVVPDEEGETFFGYYDKSPENNSSDYIVCHQTIRSTKKLPSPNESIRIICLDLKTKEKVVEIETSAYNWQQGARLQWLTTTSFIYNDFDSVANRYISRIIDLNSPDQPVILPSPVSDVFKDKYFLTLNYARLAAYSPDYGYRNMVCLEYGLDNLKQDGVFIGTLGHQSSEPPKLLLSIDRLIQIKPLPSMVNASHTINHLMISPDGKSFLLTHRWFMNGERFDRLLHISCNGCEVKILADQSMVSHVSWIDSKTVAGYFRGTDGNDGYYKINVVDGQEEPLTTKFSYEMGDGHPSFRENLFLTDSYPDRSRMKTLSLYDFREEKLTVLGQFYESLKFNAETRCDLHPRFSQDGNAVYFDSVHTGRRRLFRIDLTGF